MAENEIDSVVIKSTQETLGKFIKKPALTDKLLRKPPFRFLQDVFSAVIRETGCFEGLYKPEELNFENIKDRDDKMRFLQKMIDVIKITTKSELKVKTSKIVAGHEADKTNELLRLIGVVINEKLDWRSAVEQVISGNVAATKKDNKTATKPKVSKETKKEKPDNKEPLSKNKTTTSITKDSDNAKRVRAKSITPTTNELKPKRITPDKDKVKVSKSTKTEKERAENKKTKTNAKATKSQSPLENQKTPKTTKEETKTPSPQNQNDEAKSMVRVAPTTNQRGTNIEIQDVPSKISHSPTVEATSITSAVNEPRRNSQQIELPSAPDAEVLQDAKNTSKSSAHRKSSGSSGKSHRSSTQRMRVEENINSTTSTANQQLDALHGINELERTATQTIKPQMVNGTDTPSMSPPPAPPSTQTNAQQHQPLQQQLQQQQQPAQQELPIGNAVDMKRETTFTRENSKDSNSNINQRPRTSLRPPSVRPPSARPGAPRRRDRNVEIVLQPNDQIKMSGINVKLETFGDFDDDGENLVIIEDANAHGINGERISGIDPESDHLTSQQQEADELAQQGHLVQQILETQKELVQQSTGDVTTNKKDDGMLGVRQSSARQMNGLRDIIQNLSKSVSPFGKLMDFIPEDIDAMQLELSMWRETYTQAASDLKRERSLTESATEPMKQQLRQIEANIKEYHEMIDASRAKILQNNERIIKMLMQTH